MTIAKSKEYFVAMPRKWRSAMKRPYVSAFIALALCLALAGCEATGLISDSALTPSPLPTPLPVGVFTTYANTAYGYTINYPENWSVRGASVDSQNFIVFNYTPSSALEFSAPPLFEVEIDADSNPSKLAPLDFFKKQIEMYGLKITVQSSRMTRLASHNAEQFVWRDDTSPYSTIQYLIPNGDTMLVISQSNAANGQPSPVFIQMLASFTITG